MRSSRKLWEVRRWDGWLVDTFTDKAAAKQATIYWTMSSAQRAPQHHRPNPILVAFRRYACLEVFGWTSELIVGQVLADLAGLPIDYAGRDTLDPAIADASFGELNHARRVLTRLYTLHTITQGAPS